MNRIYRLVFNRALGRVQVASELARGAGTRAVASRPARGPARQAMAGALLLALSATPVAFAATLPTGGVVTEGSAGIDAAVANTLTINQSTAKALINWATFNISLDGVVNFSTPSRNAVTINLVDGGTPSTIAGQLNSNGQVFLVNRSGMLFTSTALVDVGGLVASTLPFNDDLVDDTYTFSSSGSPISAQLINNGGTLNAGNGSITLLSAALQNDGSLTADQINLLGAGGATLTFYDSGDVTSYTPVLTDPSTVVVNNTPTVLNTGTLTAGKINVHAMAAPNMLANVVNLGGAVFAERITGDGQLSLLARGGGVAQGATVRADHVTVTSPGGYTQSGTSTMTAKALSLDVTGDVALTSADNRISDLHGTVTNGFLALTNGVALTQSSALNVQQGETRIFNGNNAILLNNAGNVFGSPMTLDGGTVNVAAAGALQLGSVRASSLEATAGGVLAVGNTDIGGDAQLAGSHVVVDDAQVDGRLTVNAANVTLSGDVTVGDDLVVNADGNLIQNSGALAVSGDSAFDAISIHLASAGNSFGGVVMLDGGHATVNAQGTLLLGGADVLSLTLAADRIALRGTIDSSGAQNYNAPVELANATELTSRQGGNIRFASTVDGAHALDITTTGRVGFGAGVGQTARLSRLAVTAGGIDLQAGVQTSGTLTFTGPVELGGSVVLASDGGDITLDGRVDGNQSLEVNTPGTTRFKGAVGGRQALTSLRTDAPGSTRLGAGIFSVGAVNLADAVWLDANAGIHSVNGDITFGGSVDGAHRLTLEALGNIQFNGAVGAATPLGGLNMRASTLQAGALHVAGNLDVGLRGSFLQSAAFDIQGDTAFESLGDIRLTNAGNRFAGAVHLAGADVRIRSSTGLALDGVDATALDAAAVETLSLHDARVAGNSRLSGGALTLGDMTLRGDLIAESDAATVSEGAVDVAGNLQLDAGTDLSQTTGSLKVGGTTTLMAGTRTPTLVQDGTIALDRDANVFSGALELTAGTAAVASGSGLHIARADIAGNSTLQGSEVRLGAVTVGGDLRVGSTAGITQDQALDVTGRSHFTAGNDIVLDNAGNRFGGAVSAQGNDITLRSGTALTLAKATVRGDATLHGAGLMFGSVGTVDIHGSLAATSGAGIMQAGALQVGGSSTFAAGNDILLGHAGNRFGDRVSLTGNALTVVAGGDLDVAVLGHGQDAAVALDAGGALRLQPGGIDTGSAALTLTSRGGTVNSNGTLAGGTLTLVGRDGIALGDDVTAREGLVLDSSGGDITQHGGRLQVGGATVVDSHGRIDLRGSGNRFTGTVALSGGDTRIAGVGPLQLAASNVGSLDVVAGSLDQTGALQVQGASTFTVAGDIQLANAANRFGGAVALDGRNVAIAAGSDLQLAQVQADRLQASAGGVLALGSADVAQEAVLSGMGVNLGSSRVGGDLAVDSGAGITQGAALQVSGASTLRAAGAVTLDAAGNDFSGAVSASGSGITLVDANDLQIAALEYRGGARRGPQPASSGGGVRLVAGGTLALPDTAIDVGDADLVLASNGGQLRTRAALRGGTLEMHARDGLVLGHDLVAGRRMVLTSAAGIEQTAGRLQAGELTGRAGGEASLLGGNQLTMLGDFQANGLQLRNAQGLVVAGNLQAGSALLLDVEGGDLEIGGQLAADAVRLQASGDLRQSGGSAIHATTLSGNVGGRTWLGDAQTFVANQIDRLGDFRAAAGFSLTNARTLTLASLNGSTFSVDAGDSAFALKVDGGDILQQGSAPVRTGTGHWWSSGRIGTESAPVYVVTSEPDQVVDFVGLPPAYFNAVGVDGRSVAIGGAVNVPTSALALRAQNGSLQRVAYVDMGALDAEYRAFGIVQPGIRLPADQAPACDHGDPDAECAQ